MAPTKSRGRPRKSDVDDSPAAVIIDTSIAPVAAPGKRGRGRPPKDPSGLPQRLLNPKVSKSTGRGRGRPPKDPNAPPKTPAKKAAPANPGSTGRPRGRPPGSGKKQAAMTKAAALALEGASGTGPKKGSRVARGGPAKTRNAQALHASNQLGEDIDMGEDAEAEDDDDIDAAAEEDDEEDGGE